jgi:SAM-dependent methyltransferase
MAGRDPHRFVNELDEAAIERLIARLENRAKDAVFKRLFDKYASRLALPASARVLEVGCGTGAILRSLARRGDFAGMAVGIDHSPAFISAARRLAGSEGVSARVEFRVGDAHGLDFPAETFDAVIAHTLLSHVADPAAVLREMARVARRTATLVIFDGDYVSLTYAVRDHPFGRQMDAALAAAAFNNPRIMRELPGLLAGLGLQLREAWGDAVAEIGRASYFKSFAETYAPYVATAGLLSSQAVQAWLAEQHQAMENGTFFASCNYYTYLVRRS